MADEVTTEPTPDAPADEVEPDAPQDSVDEPLGEPGKRALDAEREARKAAEKRASAIEAELTQLREAQMTEQERAVAEARRAGESDATAKVLERLFSAEVRAAAASKVTDPDLFADPAVAMRLLGIDAVPTDEAGDINRAAIAQSIDALIEAKPYLAAKASATRPTGEADGGARGAGTPGQLTREDLRSMSPEQIVQAKADGLLNDLLGAKS